MTGTCKCIGSFQTPLLTNGSQDFYKQGLVSTKSSYAFGQPDIESITRSEKLKWLHISTAGFTRYDTPGFRALVAERGLIVTNSSSVYASACAEHVFNMLPDNPASYRFINAARLAQMKPTAVF
jgi:phosphoglycerate dehydrogenase-like enzyme